LQPKDTNKPKYIAGQSTAVPITDQSSKGKYINLDLSSIDGLPAQNNTSVSYFGTVSGTITTGLSGWIYIATRRPGCAWFIHHDGFRTALPISKTKGGASTSSRLMPLMRVSWQVPDVQFGVHGADGNNIDVAAIFSTTPLSAGFVRSGRPDFDAHSYTYQVRVVTPKVRVMHVWNQPVAGDRVLSGPFIADVDSAVTNVPNGAAIQYIVQPDNSNVRWIADCAYYNPLTDQSGATIYLGRKNEAGDNYQNFRLSVIVTRQPLPANNDIGITQSEWENHWSRYILATSPVVILERTSRFMDVGISLSQVGTADVGDGLVGSEGHQALLVGRNASFIGKIQAPPGELPSSVVIWLVARDRDSSVSDWKLVTSPVIANSESDWRVDDVLLNLDPAKVWLVKAVIAMDISKPTEADLKSADRSAAVPIPNASTAAENTTFKELKLRRCVAESNTVWIQVATDAAPAQQEDQ
jgi:hypothetical protein